LDLSDDHVGVTVQREALDAQLGALLQQLEDWLGPWKWLLRGEALGDDRVKAAALAAERLVRAERPLTAREKGLVLACLQGMAGTKKAKDRVEQVKELLGVVLGLESPSEEWAAAIAGW
jgi:hypothetical protein